MGRAGGRCIMCFRVICNLFRLNIVNDICPLILKPVSSFLNKNMHTCKQTHTETLSVKDPFLPGSHVFIQTILELVAENSLWTSNISFCLCDLLERHQCDLPTLNQNFSFKKYSSWRLVGGFVVTNSIKMRVLQQWCNEGIRVSQTFNPGKQSLSQNNMTFLPAWRKDFPVSLSVEMLWRHLSEELHIPNLCVPSFWNSQILLQAALLAFVAPLWSGLCYSSLAWRMD